MLPIKEIQKLGETVMSFVKDATQRIDNIEKKLDIVMKNQGVIFAAVQGGQNGKSGRFGNGATHADSTDSAGGSGGDRDAGTGASAGDL